MADKEEYGIEDLCESLDGIEEQLKRLIYLKKRELYEKYPSIQGLADI